MCRHAAYVGPGIALTELTRDLPHSLYHQSFQARQMLRGSVNADGFGVGWYDPDVRPEPARYASPLPIWSDTNLPSFGPLIRSPLVVAAVRNATVEGTTDAANNAPFVSGRYLWSLNGYLEDFAESWKEEVLWDWIDRGRRTQLRGQSDAEHLFQAVLSRAGEAGSLPEAVLSVLRDAKKRAAETGKGAQLNLLLSDGETLIATRCGASPTQTSLYHLWDGDEFPDGHVVASEPLYDDPLWQSVAEDTLLILRDGAPPVRLRV